MEETFNSKEQNKIAEQFHALHHHQDHPLLLANAWDAMSAKLVEMGGLQAVATTSSGISWTCGYADGEHIPPEIMGSEIRKIVRTVNIPVTADIEGGYYGDNIKKINSFTEQVIKAGAVGVNLEDSDARTGELISTERYVSKLKAVRSKARELGVHLYINARIDAMLIKDSLENRLKIIFERAEIYKEAGASGIFVPFVSKMETVKRLKENIALPLNILMAPSLEVRKLKELKVNRISVGGRPSLVAKSVFKKIVDEMKNSDQWETLFTNEITHPQANKWFTE